MTVQELDTFLSNRSNIETCTAEDADGGTVVGFRNTDLPWYIEDDSRATWVSQSTLDKISADALLREINRGLDVVGIARVTGYFSVIKNWNAGKLAELNDRHKCEV